PLIGPRAATAPAPPPLFTPLRGPVVWSSAVVPPPLRARPPRRPRSYLLRSPCPRSPSLKDPASLASTTVHPSEGPSLHTARGHTSEDPPAACCPKDLATLVARLRPRGSNQPCLAVRRGKTPRTTAPPRIYFRSCPRPSRKWSGDCPRAEQLSARSAGPGLESWWVGDIPVSGSLLTDWSQDTMKELHLAIPAEITREKLNQVANAVYKRMDQLYQGKMYFPGYFPNELRAIFREQVHLIQNAIIESRIDCQRHCGIFQYETISCTNCTDSHVVCFGYNCEQSTSTRTTPAFLISPSFTCLEPPHLANLTLENASECLMQH
uniref:IZUMO family member 4 n=1 Tax=Sus scrofa TaxID=9823 RepID=A0A4X1VTK4_PIG